MEPVMSNSKRASLRSRYSTLWSRTSGSRLCVLTRCLESDLILAESLTRLENNVAGVMHRG